VPFMLSHTNSHLYLYLPHTTAYNITVRATHGVHSGAYYYETEILFPTHGTVSATADAGSGVCVSSVANCNVRLGWSTRQGELQGPVGNDTHSYGYRDISGSTLHKGVRTDGYGDSYGPGDIIGCFLNLDPGNVTNNQMRFFKNGVDQVCSALWIGSARPPFGGFWSHYHI